jgi:hypothetical protein
MLIRTRPLRRQLLLALVACAALTAWGHPPTAAAATGWTWPVVGDVITPYRNGSDPYAGGQHRGIDVGAPTGTPVAVAVAGTVRFAGTAGSSGLTVSIRTADGRFDTSYLHLSSVEVARGDRVRVGQRLGAVGTSGRRSAVAPHLHFGVRDAGSRHGYRDPLDFLPPPGTPPVRERPRAPVPVGAPVIPSPSREPVGSRSPHRAPAPRRVRIPGRRRVPLPGGGRLPVPAAYGRPLPQLSPTPLLSPIPVAGGRRAPRSAPHPERIPARGPVADPAPDRIPSAVPRRMPAEHPRTSPKPGSGPDLGWALACAGLLLAAGCIGHSADGDRDGARRTRSLSGLLRPLLGRR